MRRAASGRLRGGGKRQGVPRLLFSFFSCLVAVAGVTLGVNPRPPPPLRLGCWRATLQVSGPRAADGSLDSHARGYWWAGGGACVPCACVAWTNNIVIVLHLLVGSHQRLSTSEGRRAQWSQRKRHQTALAERRTSRRGLSCARLRHRRGGGTPLEGTSKCTRAVLYSRSRRTQCTWATNSTIALLHDTNK